jgi:hypothetical protein
MKAPSALQTAEQAAHAQRYPEAIEQFNAVLATEDTSEDGLRDKEAALLGLGRVHTKLK